MMQRAVTFLLLSTGLVLVVLAAGWRFGAILNDDGDTVINDAAETTAKPDLEAERLVPAVQFRDPAALLVELHARSPFDPLRRQFEAIGSELPEQPPPPPPRLLGITGNDKDRRALVEWPGSGAFESLAVGSDTPLGVVTGVSDDAVTMGQGEGATTVTLFQ
jgi:fermentation-respiration switch protein FrsA (DUF1100 family)